MLNFIKNYIIQDFDLYDTLLLIVSTFVIIEYLLKKRTTRKSAATSVYLQLKSFDDAIDSIKKVMNEHKDISDYHMFSINQILDCNHWNELKHLLINKLNEEDIVLIEKTYSIIESIETSRRFIIDSFATTNNAKSYALQFKVIENVDDEDNISEICKKFNKAGAYFSSRTPHDVFVSKINEYRNITGTTTLNKIRKLSYID